MVKPHKLCPIEYKIGYLGYRYLPYSPQEVALYELLLEVDNILIADKSDRLFPERDMVKGRFIEHGIDPVELNIYFLSIDHKEHCWLNILLSLDLVNDIGAHETIKKTVLEKVRQAEVRHFGTASKVDTNPI